MHWGAACALACAGSVALLIAPANAQTVGFTGALYGVRGTYPTERVNSVYVFTGGDVTVGPVRVMATLPFIRASTTPDATVTSTPLTSTTSTGVGDPLVRVDVRLGDNPPRRVQIGLAGAVKVPIVDAATGRGSGEADYGLGWTTVTTIQRTSLMADVMYWTYGDPEGADFTDTWSYSVGVARVVGGGRSSLMASIGGFSSGVGVAPPPVALTVGLLTLVQRRQSLALTASVGLTDSSSDVSVGASWRLTR